MVLYRSSSFRIPGIYHVLRVAFKGRGHGYQYGRRSNFFTATLTIGRKKTSYKYGQWRTKSCCYSESSTKTESRYDYTVEPAHTTWVGVSILNLDSLMAMNRL